MIDGIWSIYKNEGGLKGLTRGIEGIALRVAFGSATQLSTYEQSKLLVLRTGFFEDNVFAHLAASCVSGLAVCTVMNPFDVVCTRLYNQKVSSGQGALYTGPIDCFLKTTRAEGFRALYKGYGAHFLRIAPHTVLTFLFWEQLKAEWDRRFRYE
jgi:solute carrier family 25, member 34/35